MSWTYKTRTEYLGDFVPEKGYPPCPAYAMYIRKDCYVYNWRQNPDTKVWEQDPNDKGPENEENY